MRYCVFSDVHSNLEAFEAVLDAFSKEGADRYVYLGDIVGYGADPHACIERLKLLEPEVLVAGNHEWGLLGLLDMEYFNEYAGASIAWTRGVINKEDTEYLRSFQLSCESGCCTFVHGSLEEPAAFKYVMDKEDAGLTMKLSGTRFTFVGHSHAAGVYYSGEDGVVRATAAKVIAQKKFRYLVNAGSVGQPRDGDPRAAYVIYDDEGPSFEIKRVAYDIKAAQDKILKAGLPAWLASRLSEGR